MRWIVPLLLAIAPAQYASAEAANTASADRFSYVLMRDGGSDSMMSGSSDDFHRAQAYRAGKAGLLYVRDGGAAYVIRDPAMLRRAETIMQPQRELGQRQGALGRQQGELGGRQGALGAEQGRIGRLMANSTPAQMHELGRQQGELGRRQSALGAQQAAHGRQQSALGHEQSRQAELARPQFRALVTDAIRRGLAQRVD